MSTILFSTAYFAPIQYYWHWNRCSDRLVEANEHYIKQTWRNRCLIATANGPMVLSLPIESGAEKTGIKEVRLSDHGNWRHLHWNGIESAYHSSPFYEYYADDLHPFFEKKMDYLFDFNESIQEKMCELLDISALSKQTEQYVRPPDVPAGKTDLRELIHPKKDFVVSDPDFEAKPYYQVFDRKFGFQPNLSILDLLFNMGPESVLYL
jgi:hypothetical protein